MKIGNDMFWGPPSGKARPKVIRGNSKDDLCSKCEKMDAEQEDSR